MGQTEADRQAPVSCKGKDAMGYCWSTEIWRSPMRACLEGTLPGELHVLSSGAFDSCFPSPLPAIVTGSCRLTMSRIAQVFLKADESLEEVNLAVQVNADPGPWITSVGLGSPPGSLAQNLLQNSHRGNWSLPGSSLPARLPAYCYPMKNDTLTLLEQDWKLQRELPVQS